MNPGAIERFHAQQKRLLEQTYDRAWRHGVSSYEPVAEHDRARRSAPAADTVAGGLLAARAAPYVAPAAPDERAKADALRGATHGLEQMVGELRALEPSASGEWVETNAWRLNAGDSVAWSGEQRGYAEAANADGQLIEWLPEADDRVCEDCGALAALPPMPLGDWPTTPANGDTVCNAGCRCVLQVADDQELGPNGEPPPLTDGQEALVSEIAERREPEPVAYRGSQRGPEIPANLRRGLAAYAANSAART